MGQERFAITVPTRHKLTVEEFCALDEAGFFRDKGRFELIEGGIYQMSPLYARHSTVTRRVANLLEAEIAEAGLQLAVFAQVSVRMSSITMPEPDVVVAAPRASGAVPLEEIRLAIEVSDSSLAHDLKRKARTYAKHGVAEYWVVDLPNDQLHQMTDPGAKGYASIEVHSFGARISAKTVPQILLDTARLA